MQLSDLPTPAILIEKSRLDANLQRMQEKADANNTSLRPHTKTHKSVALAKAQLSLGAHGITVAKVGEAEVYMGNGISDVRIAYNVIGDEKYQRVLSLMDKGRISFCVDTIEGSATGFSVL